MPLFTDASIVGNIGEGYGPYQFLNTVAGMQDTRALRPAIVWRFDSHISREPSGIEKTDEGQYHGGWLGHEGAAMVSLCLGVRARAGGVTREFEPDGDPKGWPTEWHYDERPTLPPSPQRSVIVPTALGQHSLDDLTPLLGLPELSVPESVALMRAARLYQEGLWVAESDANLTWLLLVSAVETAASHWRAAKDPPLERMRAAMPKLETLLMEKGGLEHTEKVAKLVADFMGATKKFGDFLLTFLPAPPAIRPWEKGRHSWDEEPMRTSLKKIYGYRSRALHGGTPFPAPMCQPAMRFGDADASGVEPRAEVPVGSGMGSMGATWLAEDIPMFLPLFEHLVRGSLLNWWRSMLPPVEVTPETAEAAPGTPALVSQSETPEAPLPSSPTTEPTDPATA